MSDGNLNWKLSEFALIASHGDDSMEQGKTLHANSCSYLHFAASYSYSTYPVWLQSLVTRAQLFQRFLLEVR